MTAEVSREDNLTHAEKDEIARERQLLWGGAAVLAGAAQGFGVALLEGGWEVVVFLAMLSAVTFCVAKAAYYSGWRLYHWQDTMDQMELLDQWKKMQDDQRL
jgi:hypothetical protein